MTAHSPLRAYRIGLGILGLFALFMLVFVVVRSALHRTDLKSSRAATHIATELNNYIYTKQSIPQSLSEAGLKDIPPSVSYERLSDKEYRFCVTYKAANKDLAGSLLQNATGAYYSGSSYSSNETLSIPSAHTKGRNCQTITPYFYQAAEAEADDSAPYKTCGTGYNYSWTFLKVNSLTPQAGDANPTLLAETYPTTTTFELNPQAKVFDRDCNPLTLADIKAGEFVNLYFNPYGAPVTMIVKTN